MADKFKVVGSLGTKPVDLSEVEAEGATLLNVSRSNFETIKLFGSNV